MTLKRKTFLAVLWTTNAAVTRAALQFAQIAVLARLLAPEDYGLMAITGAVLSFAGLFVDLGLNGAFVQRRHVTEEQRSSLFWLNVAASTGMMLFVMAASPLLAGIFGDDRLIPLMMFSSTTFVLNALGQQIRLSAEKELNFRPVMMVEITAACAGFAASVVAALSGWGVYSLVVSGIASAMIGTVLTWIFISKGWRPMRRLRLSDIKSFLGFGSATVANDIVSQINVTIDLFLGGRLLSTAELGLYSVPRNLCLQLQWTINPIITRVGFPLIAQVQSDIDRVRSIYLKTLSMTAATNAPLYLGIAAFAPDLVAVLLGTGWKLSGEVLRVLALWGMIRSTANPVGSLLFGMGRADLSLKWNVALLLIIPLALWVGSQSGPIGLAWSLLALQVALFVPGWYWLVRPVCHAHFGEYSSAVLRPLLIAVISLIPAVWMASWPDSAVGKLVVGITVSAPLYLGLSVIGNREWVRAMTGLMGLEKISVHNA